jgi:adenylate cyclase
MATEIERKWLVRGDEWRGDVSSSTRIRQAYLAADVDRSVRVRVRGDGARLTVKVGTDLLARTEIEVPLAVPDAEALLDPEAIVGEVVDKTRHLVPLPDGLVAEVDEFHGANAGLVVAEVELPDTDTHVDTPDWFGEEVTDDPRYLNARLAVDPFGAWSGGEPTG